MTIDRGTVRHMAKLAELAVADREAEALAGELERIVRFVEQLADAELDTGDPGAVVVGPDQTPLREDVVAPIPMTRTAHELAPEMRDGFFVVPRLGGMADA